MSNERPALASWEDEARELVAECLWYGYGGTDEQAKWVAEGLIGALQDNLTWKSPADVSIDRDAAEAALRVLETYPLLRDAHAATSIRSALALVEGANK